MARPWAVTHPVALGAIVMSIAFSMQHAAAAPSVDGFVALFTTGCPTGWSELDALGLDFRGRMLLLTNNSYQAGNYVGK